MLWFCAEVSDGFCGSAAPLRASLSSVLLRIGVLVLLSPIAWGLEQGKENGKGAENLLPVGDFEAGAEKGTALWSREPGAIRLSLDKERKFSGRQAVRLEHRGQQDWSFQLESTAAGGGRRDLRTHRDVLGGRHGEASLCVVLRDARGEVLRWTHGEVSCRETGTWETLTSRFLIAPGVATITPRVIGRGPATVWVDAVALRRVGKKEVPAAESFPEQLRLQAAHLTIELSPRNLALRITDRKSGAVWQTRPLAGQVATLALQERSDRAELRLFHWPTGLELKLTLLPEKDVPEVVLQLEGNGPMQAAVYFPGSFVTSPGQLLILPVNEGISYPVDDVSLSPMDYHLYGGHGLCMAWWGIVDGGKGIMGIVETPDDAHVGVPREEKLLTLAPYWIAQKGQFGYPRRLRLVVFDQGGYVAMCKRYRRYAQADRSAEDLVRKTGRQSAR